MGLIFWIYGFDLGFVGLIFLDLWVWFGICGFVSSCREDLWNFWFDFFIFGICGCAKESNSNGHDL